MTIHAQKTRHTVPLVGAHFRPPAKLLLQSVPAGFPLELRPEPSNPYDSNAIAVWLDTKGLNDDAIDELTSTLPGMGHDIEEVLAQRWWQIGYVARQEAAALQEPIGRRLAAWNQDNLEHDVDPVTGYPATLAFAGDGSPRVTFNL